MNIEDISEYCLSKKGASEDFPFDEETLVFKVMAKNVRTDSFRENSSTDKFKV